MWEVDPETKNKLLALQKRHGNDRCCDCGAPSPQWASPKFGNFICLVCAGLHRGLGVHISFVRSITMDAFKGAEMARMDMGGNEAWRKFWEEKEKGKRWDDVSLEERYGGEVADEWKERLGCKVEGKEFTGLPPKKESLKKKIGGETGESTPARTASPAGSLQPGSKKEQNEVYFARLGNENAHRPAGLPPSQGGKYGGFGSEPPVAPSGAGRAADGGGIPGVDEFQRDPVAALTKGLGWFTTTVGKGAKTVNDGWIQPTAQKIASADIPTQARLTAASITQNITTGTKGAAEQFHKLLDDGAPASTAKGPLLSSSSKSKSVEPDRRDFWDSFGTMTVGVGGEMERGKERGGGKGSAIGTAAMRKGGGGGGGGGGKEDGWDEW